MTTYAGGHRNVFPFKVTHSNLFLASLEKHSLQMAWLFLAILFRNKGLTNENAIPGQGNRSFQSCCLNFGRATTTTKTILNRPFGAATVRTFSAKSLSF